MALLLLATLTRGGEEPFNNGNQPTLIGPGIVSSADGEYSPTYDPARQELYFMRRTPGLFDYTIMVSRFEDGQWTKPIVAPFSGRFRDAGPALSPDGDTLVFDSQRPNSPLTESSIDLYRVIREGDSWSEPELLLVASRDAPSEPAAGRDEFGPLLTPNGDLYFYSFRKPDRGGRHYRVRADQPDVVEHSTELPDPSNRTFVGYLTLSADGNLAIIEGRQSSGRATDLYFSRIGEDGVWEPTQPIASLNTRYSEGTPYLSPDGKYLFFGSNRPVQETGAGDSNLYMIPLEAILPDSE